MKMTSIRQYAGFVPILLPFVLFFLIGLVIPGYLSPISFRSLLLLASLLGIAAIGQTLTVLIGGIDLSIPAVIGLADVVLALFYGAGYPIGLIIPLILVLGGVIGMAQGYISHRLGVNPLVVTMAVGSIIFGVIWSTTHGEIAGRVPRWLTGWVSVISNTGPIPVPPAVVLWLVLAALVVFVQRRTVLGRWIYAMGANPRAAELANVPQMRVWIIVYGLSGVFAAVSGILLAGFSGAADPTVGQTYLFTTIAAVVVGGTSLIGGRGGYGRTIAGSFILIELTTLFVGLGLQQPAQQICLGILIIALVSLHGREAHVKMRV
jgi:ribose transport system permease protein